MNTDDEIDEDWKLGDQLRELFTSDTDLAAFATEKVDHRLRARSIMGTAAELLGLGLETVRVVLMDNPDAADREEEGT